MALSLAVAGVDLDGVMDPLMTAQAEDGAVEVGAEAREDSHSADDGEVRDSITDHAAAITHIV